MQRQIKWFLILIILFLYTSINAQDLKTTVTINTDQLQTAARDRLRNFVRNVQDYLNKNKFHEEKIRPINVKMLFNFTAVTGTDNYEVQLVVASQREVWPFTAKDQKYSTAFKFLDERVAFTYNDNIPLVKNDFRFDSFLSLLDYYAYMVVAYDEDSWNPKGGNKYFQKAIDICNKPMSDKRGWTESGGGSRPTRLLLVQEIINPRFDNFRQAYWEYSWMGLDSLAFNKKDAFKNILNAVEKISTVKKNEVKAYNIDIFFDAKNSEIANTFLDYGDRSVYDKFIRFDPVHQREYEEGKNKAH